MCNAHQSILGRHCCICRIRHRFGVATKIKITMRDEPIIPSDLDFLTSKGGGDRRRELRPRKLDVVYHDSVLGCQGHVPVLDRGVDLESFLASSVVPVVHVGRHLAFELAEGHAPSAP